MTSLLELFCHVDDFWQRFRPWWYAHLITSGQRQRIREGQLCESEIMTILIRFHQSHYRDFKAFYTEYEQQHWRCEFPKLVSYSRFVRLTQRVAIPLFVYLHEWLGTCSGISFIDSTPLRVCHNRRIPRHKVFAGLAGRGKNSLGWFYGFKLHWVVNDRGELLAVRLTPGNVDDRQPVPDLIPRLFGKLLGDKGYLSAKLRDDLGEQGLQLITTLRRNMKPQLMDLMDRLLLRKRSIIETINDQLKNISQIEHSRHRSVVNFLVNLIAGLIAYSLRPTKPSVQVTPQQVRLLTAG